MTTGIGFLGCGNILGRYVAGLRGLPGLEIRGCAGRSPERARAAAAENGIAAFDSVAELLDSPDIDVVVNITPPEAHHSTTRAALLAGKHVYVEKTITTRLSDAADLVATAGDRLLACAPDTFLGSAAQTARYAIDQGMIGEPLAVSGFIVSARVETWHPDPTFLFRDGGGPVADVGPYDLTAMVNLFGPIRSVSARTRVGRPVIDVTSPGRRVDRIDVSTDTYAAAVLEFESGVIGTLIAGSDIWDHHLPRLEVYGTEGTLALADPNVYDADVLLRRRTDPDWQILAPVGTPFARPGTDEQFRRGPGVADLVGALNGGTLRTTPALACHVLETIENIARSGASGLTVANTTRAPRPEPVGR